MVLYIMSDIQNIQWFPGHMTKAKRKISESLKLVDLVVEVADARVPISSRNPDIDDILGVKAKLVILNKCDLADEASTKKFIHFYRSRGTIAVPVDCKSPAGADLFIKETNKFPFKGAKLRFMVVGIPNSGKSSLINRLCGSGKAAVEDRPGVTKGNQWFSSAKGFEILDTPGVLWPKFEDPSVGEKLAFVGSIRDKILDIEALCVRLLLFLSESYPGFLSARYKLSEGDISSLSSFDLMALIAKKRGMLISGGEPDLERVAAVVIDEFRAGKLGRVTLDELPN